MKKILHSIRNKPDHIKSRYVILFSVIATALIVGLWIITLQLTKTSDDTIQTESPVKVFKELIKGTTANVQKKESPVPVDQGDQQQDESRAIIDDTNTAAQIETTSDVPVLPTSVAEQN